MTQAESPKQKQTLKLVVMGCLLVGVGLLTWYFHATLKQCTIFTHLFYIPIILSCVWWKKKGYIVAAALGALLIGSHVFLRPATPTGNDYLRAVMFMVIAVVAVALRERFEKAERALRENHDKLSHDASRRRCAAAELREQRDRAQEYLDVAGVMMVALDADGNVTLINRKSCEILGYKDDEILRKNWFDNFLPETHKAPTKKVFQELMAGLVEPVEYYENPVLTRDGSERIIYWHNATLRDEEGQIIGTLASGTDITERKRVEEELRRREKDLRDLFEAAKTVSFIRTDLSGAEALITQFSPGAENIFGYKREEIVGQPLAILHLPEHVASFPYVIENMRKTGKPRTTETTLVRKSGESFPALLTTHPIFDSTDKMTGVLGVSIDITERKQAEEALRESEGKLDAILQALTDHMSMTDKDLNIIWANEVARRTFGNDIVGRKCYEVYHGRKEPCPPELCLTLKAFHDGKVHEHDTEVTGRDEKTRCFHFTANVALRDKNGKPTWVIAISRDITERKQTEKKLLAYQSQLKDLASQLSEAEEKERSRVAHHLHDEIAQILAVAKIKLATVREATSSADTLQATDEVGELIDHAIEEMRTLSAELSPPVLYLLGLEAALKWLARQFMEQHGITIQFVDDEQPKPLGRETRTVLFRAVRELLVNVAKHAQTGNAKICVQRDGRNIRIRVEDHGAGFDTTKTYPYGEDMTGFGLLSIRERLEYLGGHFDVKSHPEHGTLITLTASLADDEEQEAAE